MTPGLGDTLAQLRVEEPSWLHDSRGVPGRPPEEAAALLASLDAEDLGVFVLAYGYGMRLGAVAQTLRHDPATVLWRVQRALQHWTDEHGTPGREAALEVGIADLLRGAVPADTALPPPPGDSASWSARDLATSLGDEVRQRLADRIDAERAPEPAVSGIGIGSIGLILLAIVGFALYGFVRDLNPLRRGTDLMKIGEFAAAREAFLKAGDTEESRKQTVLCWLAEGQFERALETMDDAVLASLMPFAPRPRTFDSTVVRTPGRALLPRGTILNPKPSFVIRPGPPADLVVTVLVGTTPLSLGKSLPDTSDSEGLVEVTWPDDWSGLIPGDTEWSVGGGEPITITLLDTELRDEIQKRVRWMMHTRDIPEAAKDFLLGHFYRNKGLLEASTEAFARLAERFPQAPYPREMVQQTARALGVDASVFLR
ncbi:MAG: hypothetical protein H6825_00060 [Planctomycetes bacterium]|nr:hypothetical protein [Planctomycetota bacterium]